MLLKAFSFLYLCCAPVSIDVEILRPRCIDPVISPSWASVTCGATSIAGEKRMAGIRWIRTIVICIPIAH
jgi:hypothetical protein